MGRAEGATRAYLVIADDELNDGISDAVFGEGGGDVGCANDAVEHCLRLGMRGLRGLLRELYFLPLRDGFLLFGEFVVLANLLIFGVVGGGDVAAEA